MLTDAPAGTMGVVSAESAVEECTCVDVGPLTPPPPISDDQLALMAKALGHPMRVRILRLLAQRRSCVTGDVVAELPLAQSTVSEHLRILRDAGLIQGEIEGPRTSYCLNAQGLAALKAATATL
ncbi:transcriptional regulator, ArsR family [mine drainage metagenome]|uniref:Transcriptional regulator, ArsR family n=1 Tax=mine drainage metagenome TaxID=410659 RepID=T1AFC8_9ZZZZ